MELNNNQLDNITLQLLTKIVSSPDFDKELGDLVLQVAGVVSPELVQTAREYFLVKVGL